MFAYYTFRHRFYRHFKLQHIFQMHNLEIELRKMDQRKRDSTTDDDSFLSSERKAQIILEKCKWISVVGCGCLSLVHPKQQKNVAAHCGISSNAKYVKPHRT